MLTTPSAKLQFVVIRNVNAPPRAVFDALTSKEGMKGWVPMCQSVEWRHPAGRTAPGVDSVRYIVLKGGLVAAERIIGWEEGRELQYTFDESSIPLSAVTSRYVGTTRVDGESTLTRLTWSIFFDTPGWQAATAPLVHSSLRAVIGMMASRLRRIAESATR